MFGSTIVLSGRVIVENIAFSWWITDALKPKLTVSHPVHGTRTMQRNSSTPISQARAIARAMLVRWNLHDFFLRHY
jgi:hypothetical protein